MKVHADSFQKIYDPSTADTAWYINDHCFIHDGERWHMFGITHEEPANPLDERMFAHATSVDLFAPQWERQDPVLHYSPQDGETHVWAPHVIRHDGLYYMYYCAGGESHETYRIHLATSKDLYHWARSGANPLLMDGFDARDPMILRVDGQWVMYYTANSEPSGGNHVVACVTSDDLLTWGNKRVVFTHPGCGTFGGPTESPYVVYRDGGEGSGYYLFIGSLNGYCDTHVFHSHDPFHFDYDREVGVIASHALEVVEHEGQYYASHAGWGQGGLYLAPLHFE